MSQPYQEVILATFTRHVNGLGGMYCKNNSIRTVGNDWSNRYPEFRLEYICQRHMTNVIINPIIECFSNENLRKGPIGTIKFKKDSLKYSISEDGKSSMLTVKAKTTKPLLLKEYLFYFHIGSLEDNDTYLTIEGIKVFDIKTSLIKYGVD